MSCPTCFASVKLIQWPPGDYCWRNLRAGEHGWLLTHLNIKKLALQRPTVLAPRRVAVGTHFHLTVLIRMWWLVHGVQCVMLTHCDVPWMLMEYDVVPSRSSQLGDRSKLLINGQKSHSLMIENLKAKQVPSWLFIIYLQIHEMNSLTINVPIIFLILNSTKGIMTFKLLLNFQYILCDCIRR